MDKVKVGMIGYKFMGKAHSNAYRALSMFFPESMQPEMKVICGRNEEAVSKAAKQFGWAEYTSDWKQLLRRDDIDLIDINAPSNDHTAITNTSAKAGLHIYSDIP